MPESRFAIKYKPEIICSAGDAFKVSTLKGDPEKTMKMALGIGMDPSKISIHNGEMVTANSKVAPDPETPRPTPEKHGVAPSKKFIQKTDPERPVFP